MKKPCNKCDHSLEYHGRFYRRYDQKCSDCESNKKYQEYLLRKRKYAKGDIIHDFADLEKYLEDNCFLYWRDKIYHHGWIESLQYHVIKNALQCGNMYKAIRLEKNAE